MGSEIRFRFTVPPPFHRSPASTVALLGLLAALAGCATQVARVEPSIAIEAAIPAAGLVAFREEGGPIDEVRPEVDTLSIADAIRLALQTDPTLQASLARVRAAQAEADESGLPPDPILDVVLRFGPDGDLRPEIGLAQELIGLLRMSRRVSAAEHHLRAEAASALGTALDVLAEVQRHYSAIQALEEHRSAIRERLETVARLRHVAEARLAGGEGTRADLIAFEIEQQSVEIEAAERANTLRLERLALARLIGQPSSAASWTVEPWQPYVLGPAPESAWIDAALVKRPEIQQAQWELRSREEELELSSSSPLEGTAAGVAFEHDGDSSVGPSISIPIVWSGRFRTRREHALALLAESRHRLTEAQRSAVEEVRAALGTLDSSLASIEMLRGELIPMQAGRRADVERMHAEREVDVTLLLLADQALQESRTRLVDLELQASLALYGLQRAVGGPAALDAIAGRMVQEGGNDE